MRSKTLLISAVAALLASTCGCEPGFFITVYFLTRPKPPKKLTLTIISDCGEPKPAVGTHRYKKGSTITASCGTTPYPSDAPASGTRFVCDGFNASGSNLPAASSATSTTFKLTTNTTITWLWHKEHKLQVGMSPAGVGQVLINPPGEWQPDGTTVTLTAYVTDPNYQFDYWLVGTQQVTNNPLQLDMTAPQTVVAVFKLSGTTQYALTVNSPYGSPDPPVGTTYHPAGDTINASVDAVADDGQPTRHICTGWSGTGSVPPSGNTNSFSFTINSDSTLVWLWEDQHRLDVSVTPADGGSVSINPSSPDNYYDPGTDVTLTATPAPGYGFVEWRITDSFGTTTDKNTQTAVHMDEPHSVEAVFALIPHANFTATPTQSELGTGVTVTFTDKSTGDITQWEWDFDNDGAVDSYDQNPTWTYNNPGWYTVTLKVEGPAGSDTCTKFKYILIANNIWYVDGTVSSSGNGQSWSQAFKTIAEGITAAGDYDLVLVADATYTEHDLDYNGKAIYLKGVNHNTPSDPNARPVIDCQQLGRAFWFHNGETEDSVLDNFTIQNGYVSTGVGGAILCENSSAFTIINSTLRRNVVDSSLYGAEGGAICLNQGASAKVLHCRFEENKATKDDGGAIGLNDASIFIDKCMFLRNKASASDSDGGAITGQARQMVVRNSIFAYNYATLPGGAITIAQNTSSATFVNCTFFGNVAGTRGGALYVNSGATIGLKNCILWNNKASNGGNEIYVYASGASVDLNNCCLPDNNADPDRFGGYTSSITENNCIHQDPQFVCPEAGVLRLRHTSPCIDAGDNSLVPSDLQTDILGCPRIVGSAVDIGAYEHQGVIYVDPVNGDDSNDGLTPQTPKQHIQPAIDAASDGWVILLADGTYKGDLNKNLDTKGKALHIVSQSRDPANCIIDCEQDGRAFHIHSAEPPELVIESLTIQNGKVEDTYGGAIVCENNSSPTITNCFFENNEAVDTNSSYDKEKGGAIYCYSSNPTVTNCTFRDNVAYWGGAIYCENPSSPTVTGCIFSGNSAYFDGGAIYCYSSNPNITNCAFSSNSTMTAAGGAIYCCFSSPNIVNCTLSNNIADSDGGGVFCNSSNPALINCTFTNNRATKDDGGAVHCYSGSSPMLNNCILWGNSAASSGDEIYVQHSGSSVVLNYCCVDNTGYGGYTGNITENNCIHDDPLFVDAQNGDYHLQDTSPCIDAGDNSLVPFWLTTDLDGKPRIVDGDNDGTPTVDIGAYEFQP